MAKYSIHIEDFSKSFGKLKAVNNLSFDVNEGEVFAFLGSNGSGKTTTIRCLLKIYQPDTGKLLINNKPYTEAFNKVLGYLPEERGLYRDAKVLDILVYTAQLRGLSKDIALKRSIKYLEQVDLIEHSRKKVSQLSSGMQQKVQLGTTLIHNPEILILDEPFKGLDPLNRQLFIEIFLERAKKGTTILYSTHVIDEAQKMADRLLIINKGERIEYGSTTEVRKKYGSDTLVVSFSGKRPLKDHKMYRSEITNSTAEIVPKEKYTTNEIIEELIKGGTQIIDLKVDYPSLNQIFIDITKKHGK